MKVFGKMKNQISILLAICLCLVGSPVMTAASVPQAMSYHGLLKDSQGSYLTGTYGMTFRIYGVATGGTALWTETQSSVSVTSGRFDIELGSVTALNLSFSSQYWLSIQVGSDSEMSPRVKLTSSGYAYNSENVVNSFTAGEHDAKSHMDVEGVKANANNVAKTNFKLDAYSSASANNMGDMIVDVFHDETGIDTNNSTHYLWQGSPSYNVTTQPAPSGIDSYTKLALHANGTDGATTFTDSSSSSKSVTANGDAQIDIAQKKFGTASGLFDGTGDYLTTSYNADFDFGTGDWTIDFWINFSARDTAYYIYNTGAAGSAAGINIYPLGYSDVYPNSESVVRVASSLSLSTGTWYHMAYVRSGNKLYYFINGTLQNAGGSDCTGRVFNSDGSGLYIGKAKSGQGPLAGSLDEFRVSKGIARWTSNFTPPTTEYAVPGDPDPATVISTSFSETAAPSETMIIGDETLNGGTITYSVSRDNGTTWTQASNGTVVSLASQPSGTQVRWKAVITGSAVLNGIATALT